MNSHLPRYYLQNCHAGQQKHVEWLMGKASGVFIAVLNRSDSLGNNIDHAVVINAEKQLIIDICERTTLQMPWSVLQQCACNTTYHVPQTSARCIATPSRLLSAWTPEVVNAKQVMNAFRSS